MRDPRTKRPSTRDLLDTRHQEWLRSLKAHPDGVEPRIIQLDNYRSGKTASVLSERELEVLQMVSFGSSSKEIAEKLFLSTHTVTNHRKNMLNRSRCGNLAELVRVAINENLL